MKNKWAFYIFIPLLLFVFLLFAVVLNNPRKSQIKTGEITDFYLIDRDSTYYVIIIDGDEYIISKIYERLFIYQEFESQVIKGDLIEISYYQLLKKKTIFQISVNDIEYMSFIKSQELYKKHLILSVSISCSFYVLILGCVFFLDKKLLNKSYKPIKVNYDNIIDNQQLFKEEVPDYLEQYVQMVEYNNDKLFLKIINREYETFNIEYFGEYHKKSKLIEEKNLEPIIIVLVGSKNTRIVLYDGYIHGYSGHFYYAEKKRDYDIDYQKLEINAQEIYLVIGKISMEMIEEAFIIDNEGYLIDKESNERLVLFQLMKKNVFEEITIKYRNNLNKIVDVVDIFTF